jgi:hypothetical protein
VERRALNARGEKERKGRARGGGLGKSEVGWNLEAPPPEVLTRSGDRGLKGKFCQAVTSSARSREKYPTLRHIFNDSSLPGT